MNWTNFIQTYGHDDPTSMLDPSAISDTEIEKDLMQVQMEMQEKDVQIDGKNEKYQEQLKIIADAPEYKKEKLAAEADQIEVDIANLEDEWAELADWKQLLKAINSFRRRIQSTGDNLNVAELLQDDNPNEVKDTLRDELLAHLEDQSKVQKVLQQFANVRSMDRNQSSTTSADVDKHINRAEQLNGSQDSRDDEDDDRSRSSVGADH